MKKTISSFVALAVVLTGVAIATPQAEAACSYNGWLNSGGKCGKSHGNKNYEKRKNNTKSKYYSASTYNTNDQLEAYVKHLRKLISALEDDLYDRDNDSEVSVFTRSVSNVNDDRATLRGRLDLGDDDEARVYFEYGLSRTNLNKESSTLTLDDNDDQDFHASLRNLNENDWYYYRAVSIDEDGERDYGSIMSFRTDSKNNDDEPDVVTGNTSSITSDEARLRGMVDMNDFQDGLVFFVYGEDRDQVEEVEDDYDSYSEVDEDGRDLQKESVDSNLDNFESYQEDISGLDEDTRIYYSICVEYEDESDDEVIICGSVKSFQTND